MKRTTMAVLITLSMGAGCSSYSAKQANTRGLACYSKKDYRCAVAEFGAAVRDAPESARYRYNLAISLAKQGLPKQAEVEAQELLRRDPSNEDARKLLTRVQADIETARANYVLSQMAN